MRLTYVTHFDPIDFRAFGGRMALVVPALRGAGATLDLFRPRRTLAHYRAYVRARLARRVFRQRVIMYRDPAVIRRSSRQIEAHLRRSPSDAVLSPMSPGSQPVAYVNADRPVVIWTDATLAGWLGMSGYRPGGRLAEANLRGGLANEAEAMRRCDLALFWSHWAAEDAIAHYRLERSRVGVAVTGPSMTVPTDLDPDTLAVHRGRRTCRLLFVGIDWKRKGGDIVLAITRALQARGVDAELTLIGANPPDATLPPGVRSLGFISKSSVEGERRLSAEFQRAHFLLLPTRSDCTPLVVNDACGHGTPVVARDIGGMRTLVHDDVNGLVHPTDADPDAYADAIAARFGDPQRYAALVRSTLEDFDRRLSWPAAARHVLDRITALIHRDTGEPRQRAVGVST